MLDLPSRANWRVASGLDAPKYGAALGERMGLDFVDAGKTEEPKGPFTTYQERELKKKLDGANRFLAQVTAQFNEQHVKMRAELDALRARADFEKSREDVEGHKARAFRAAAEAAENRVASLQTEHASELASLRAAHVVAMQEAQESLASLKKLVDEATAGEWCAEKAPKPQYPVGLCVLTTTFTVVVAFVTLKSPEAGVWLCVLQAVLNVIYYVHVRLHGGKSGESPQDEFRRLCR